MERRVVSPLVTTMIVKCSSCQCCLCYVYHSSFSYRMKRKKCTLLISSAYKKQIKHEEWVFTFVIFMISVKSHTVVFLEFSPENFRILISTCNKFIRLFKIILCEREIDRDKRKVSIFRELPPFTFILYMIERRGAHNILSASAYIRLSAHEWCSLINLVFIPNFITYDGVHCTHLYSSTYVHTIHSKPERKRKSNKKQ